MGIEVQKVHFLGVPHPPKIDPGYGPEYLGSVDQPPPSVNQWCRPSFLRSSITLELLNLLLTLFEENHLLGSLFVPVPVILMLAISN